MRKRDIISQCEHCGRGCRGRWCRVCWAQTEARRIAEVQAVEETDEDLERIIAEQRRRLPPWWDEETRKMLSREDEERPPIASRAPPRVITPEIQQQILAELGRRGRKPSQRLIAIKYGCSRGVVYRLQKQRRTQRQEARCA